MLLTNHNLKPFILSTLFCLVFLASQFAQGIDNEGNYAIWGMGHKSCYNYQNARLQKADQIKRYRDFIMGYLTAYNAITPETYRISGGKNLNQILVWVDAYCDKQAISSVESALIEFTDTHYKARLKSIPTIGRER